jgi:hypothetical protein
VQRRENEAFSQARLCPFSEVERVRYAHRQTAQEEVMMRTLPAALANGDDLSGSASVPGRGDVKTTVGAGNLKDHTGLLWCVLVGYDEPRSMRLGPLLEWVGR